MFVSRIHAHVRLTSDQEPSRQLQERDVALHKLTLRQRRDPTKESKQERRDDTRHTGEQ